MDISESLSPRARPRDGESYLMHPGVARPQKSSLSLEGGLALSLALSTLAAAAIWLGVMIAG